MAESRFPMHFDKCPQCGSKETITQLAWDEEAEKGRVEKDTPVAAEHVQTPLLDPRKTLGITTGVLMLHIDYCAKCGARYCTGAEVELGQVRMGPPPGQQGRGGMPPFIKGN